MATPPTAPIGAASYLALVPGGFATSQTPFVLCGIGSFVANGVTAVTVVDPNVTANSIINFTLQTVGGTVGAIPAIKTITPGTGFTVAGTASDTSTYAYMRIG